VAVMTQHRNTLSVPVRMNSHPRLREIPNDETLRIMVFCAAANTGVQDIAFPHQCELKVNGDEVKTNLRGLKNKPGSTRPADITKMLRLKPTYTNNLEFTYALTQKVGSVRPVSGGRGEPGTSYPCSIADQTTRNTISRYIYAK